jgi:hypothetical protein
MDSVDTYRQTPSQIYAWISAVQRCLPPAVRLRYRPLIWVVLSFLRVFRVLPCRWAAMLTLYMNGGNLLIKGTKPASSSLLR